MKRFNIFVLFVFGLLCFSANGCATTNSRDDGLHFLNRKEMGRIREERERAEQEKASSYQVPLENAVIPNEDGKSGTVILENNDETKVLKGEVISQEEDELLKPSTSNNSNSEKILETPSQKKSSDNLLENKPRRKSRNDGRLLGADFTFVEANQSTDSCPTDDDVIVRAQDDGSNAESQNDQNLFSYFGLRSADGKATYMNILNYFVGVVFSIVGLEMFFKLRRIIGSSKVEWLKSPSSIIIYDALCSMIIYFIVIKVIELNH